MLTRTVAQLAHNWGFNMPNKLTINDILNTLADEQGAVTRHESMEITEMLCKRLITQERTIKSLRNEVRNLKRKMRAQ